jgi:Gpi18-like mannosyltransferase
VIGVYAAVLVVLNVVSWLVVRNFAETASVPPHHFAGESLLDGWFRWDASWYLRIADLGYSYTPGKQSTVAFFPGYPLTMRAVGNIIDNSALAGILITMACGLLAFVLFRVWTRSRLSPSAALTALVLLALYPYAFFLFGAVYGDALFLAAALSAFLLLERGHPVLAGLAGAVATATRPVGVAVVVGLIVLSLERRDALIGTWRLGLPRRIDLRKLRAPDFGVLLSLGGFAAYAGYLWSRFGDPFVFSTVQAAWGQPATPRTWSKYTFFAELFRGDDRRLAYILLLHAIVGLLFLISIPFVVRRFGWGYGSYATTLLMIPLIGSSDFQGLGRYMLAMFPTFALAGELLADRPSVRNALLPVSACLLLLLTAGFAHGVYVS